MKLEKKVCPICGEDIIFRYSKPDRYFYINENGDIEEDLNNQLYLDYEYSYFCSGDMEHDVDGAFRIKLEPIDDWVDEVEERIFNFMY
jgi:hypothetical protein